MKALVTLLVVLTIIASAQVTAATVAVGAFGYHPSQYKQVVVYTTAPSGSFTIFTTAGAQAFSGTLAKPKDSSGNTVQCQGNQACLVGDFTGFTTQGTYYIMSGADRSQDFSISTNAFRDRAPLFLEVFEALKQQGSAYHANLHSQETPPFLAMADGSFVMTTDQATVAGIRLANAYNRNPQLFSFDNYRTTNAGAPDLAEHIKQHVQIVAGYQDAAGGTAVPYGYEFNFQCPMDYTPMQERFTTGKDACLLWRPSTTASSAVGALHLYAAAIPAINQIDGNAAAVDLLNRAKRTYSYVKSTYTLADDTAASFGAAAFMLYDYTGDSQYLQDAYAQRSKVNQAFDAQNTQSREFYWEEYARHKDRITGAGLQYDLNGKQPESFFKQKVLNDWGAGSLNPISRNGERLYILDLNVDFHNSRYMLSEALFAAKSQEFGSDATVKIVEDSQLAWLTGMNSVIYGNIGGPLRSQSFIFGIGSNGKNQHTRLVPSTFYQDGLTFTNGKKYIPGWISGAKNSFDSNNTFNYYDDYWNWKYVETTDEIVAQAIELSAYLDAQYNGRPAIARPLLTSAPPACTPTTEVCNGKDDNCNGQVDENNVCANTTQPPACTPTIEVCDGKDNNCNGQVDENNVCAPACVPSAEVCDGKDNNCDGQIDENNVCTPSGCFSDVNSIPVTCTGGTIVREEYGPCHTIICSGGSSSLKALACNKPDNGPQYFEMYVQDRNGTGIKICLGETCVGENGYAKSANYPICVQAPVQTPADQPVNQTPAPYVPPVVDAPVSYSGGGGGGGGAAPVMEDLDETPKTATLFTYNSYSFSIGGKVHSVNLKDATNDNVTIVLRSTPVELTLQQGEGRNVDLDADGTSDIYVKAVKMTQNSATLTLRTALPEPPQEAPAETPETKPAEQPALIEQNTTGNETVFENTAMSSDTTTPESITEAPVETTTNAQYSSKWLWVLGGLALVAIAGMLIYRSRPEPRVELPEPPLAPPVSDDVTPLTNEDLLGLAQKEHGVVQPVSEEKPEEKEP